MVYDHDRVLLQEERNLVIERYLWLRCSVLETLGIALERDVGQSFWSSRPINLLGDVRRVGVDTAHLGAPGPVEHGSAHIINVGRREIGELGIGCVFKPWVEVQANDP